MDIFEKGGKINKVIFDKDVSVSAFLNAVEESNFSYAAFDIRATLLVNENIIPETMNLYKIIKACESVFEYDEYETVAFIRWTAEIFGKGSEH